MPGTMTEPKAPAPKKREKKASYHVLRQDEGGWNLLTKTPIQTVSRRAAIVEATKAEKEKGGTFLVLPEKEYNPIKRVVKQVEIDEFA